MSGRALDLNPKTNKQPGSSYGCLADPVWDVTQGLNTSMNPQDKPKAEQPKVPAKQTGAKKSAK